MSSDRASGVPEKAAEAARLPRGDAEQLLLAIQAFVRVERRLTDTHSDLATTLDGGCVEEYMDALAEVGRLMREAKTTRIVGTALAAACDRSLGLDGLVRLGDVVEALRDARTAKFNPPLSVVGIPERDFTKAADFIEREFGGEGER